MTVRPAVARDGDAIWAILEPIIRAGETYTIPRHWTQSETLAYWTAPQHEVFVAEASGQIIGTYFLRPNQLGGGAHVANCGYATAPSSQGKGVARLMCRHSLDHARNRGFLAMQFNFVISSNQRAVALWKSLGFQIVGQIPAAFQHPTLGLVDALVMYLQLTPIARDNRESEGNP